MALFGYLYLNNGRWNTKQIIPEWWVNESTIGRMDGVIADYGYQWWSRSDGLFSPQKEANNLFLYFAFGFKGQFIFVIPQFNMVVVVTSEFEEAGLEVFALLADYIFPAVQKNDLN
jgi:CubicO group peptidase (beta-lactamase class C family)